MNLYREVVGSSPLDLCMCVSHVCYYRKGAGSWLMQCFSHSAIQMHQARMCLIEQGLSICWLLNVQLSEPPVDACIDVCVCVWAYWREASGDFSAQLLKVASVKELQSISAQSAVCMCVPEARPDPGPEPLPATDETRSTSLLCLHSPLGRLTCLPPGSFGFEPQNRT